MSEFARLAVGTLLLGLAIFMSLNFEDQPAADDASDSSSEAVDAQQPDWQAEPDPANRLAIRQSNDALARPQFDDTPRDVFARPVNSRLQVPTDLNQPPRISDQYHPSQPLTVTGQLQRSNMVPVQPKPMFTGTISAVRQLHTVRDGDTLQSIAREYFGSADRYLDIYLLNKDVLSNPARLPVGAEVRIPAG